MSETRLEIRKLGDAILRKKAKTIKAITSNHREILSKMAQLMYESSGIGLAANQVGINESLAVVDIGQGLYKLINPRIVKKEGWQAMEEGCLSVPGVSVKVKRARKVIVKAIDENAKPLIIEAEGMLACVFQHEIDHLKGRLIIDYAPFFKRWRIKKQLNGSGL